MYQNVVEYIKIYGKSPFSIKFQKKKSPWVGLELTKRNKKIDEKIWKIWRVKFCRLSSKSQPNLDSLIKSVYITEFSYRSRHIRQKDPLITYRGRTGKRSSSRTQRTRSRAREKSSRTSRCHLFAWSRICSDKTS